MEEIKKSFDEILDQIKNEKMRRGELFYEEWYYCWLWNNWILL
jgi:hypothetical protein